MAELQDRFKENQDVEVIDTTKKLKIGAKISFAKLVEASVSFESEAPTETKVKTTKKDSAKIVQAPLIIE